MDDLFEHQHEMESVTERDKAINGFYTHFMLFIAVIAGLAIINLVSGDAFWIQWVVLGWGLGIALHAFLVFVRRPQREHALREARRERAARRAAAAAATASALPATPDETP
jgi:hypothetical protein